MSVLAIAICSYNYVNLELEDQIRISGEINYPPLHSVFIDSIKHLSNTYFTLLIHKPVSKFCK